MGVAKAIKKKVKYRSIILKVSHKQKQIIDDYCKQNSLGTVQLIKLALREYIERNPVLEKYGGHYMMSENQLTIFDVITELEQDD